MGIDARIVTRRWHGERRLPDGTPILVTADSEGARKATYDRIERWLWRLESPLTALQQTRFTQAMGSETWYKPSVSPWVADALSISRFVQTLRPQFICGQEVFAYGLATAFSRHVPRMLMPWGGDVYMYARTTAMAFLTVRHALRHVDLVVPGSPIARDYIHERFGVPLKRMHCGGLWALNRERFRRATKDQRTRVCARFGIDPHSLVIMNVRRFFPAWGSEVAFPAFLQFAEEWRSAHFILLGGSGTESRVAEARKLLTSRGLSARFTMFDGDISIDDCAALMSIADIFVSMMLEQDMRPLASILEAAASGGAPILGDQPEYRVMESLGFRAAFCKPGGQMEVLDALRRYAASEDLRQDAVNRNLRYLDANEDGTQQAVALLRRMRSLCTTYSR
jgi:glycosyltransferase involved in cell wall biosynthesis